MKLVTATEANRDFSKLLERVAEGESIGVTKRGKILAVINPAHQTGKEITSAKQRLLSRLRAQPCLGIARRSRDELYDD